MAPRAPDPVTQEIIKLVVGLAERMRTHFGLVSASFGLAPMEGRALFALSNPRPMRELADQLSCDASYVTGITNRLEAEGLVERQTDPADRRVKRIVVTPKGQRLRKAMQLQAEQDLPATAGLTASQRIALRDLLRTVRDHGTAELSDASPGAFC